MCFHTNILLCFREQCNYLPILRAGSPADAGVRPNARPARRAFSPARARLGEPALLWAIPLLRSQFPKPQDTRPRLRAETARGSRTCRTCPGTTGAPTAVANAWPPQHPPIAEGSLHSAGHTPAMGILHPPAVPGQQRVFWPAASRRSTYLGSVGEGKRHAGRVRFEMLHPRASSLSDVPRQTSVPYHEQCHETRNQTAICWTKAQFL